MVSTDVQASALVTCICLCIDNSMDFKSYKLINVHIIYKLTIYNSYYHINT